MGDDRPPCYVENGALVIRASAMGTSCLWELVAAGQGYPLGTLPTNLIKAFSEGTNAEPYVINRLKEEYGMVFLSAQEEADWHIDLDLIVRHHPDGIANLGSDFWFNTRHNHNLRCDDTWEKDKPPRTVIVEVKWLSDGLWQKFVKQGMGQVIAEYPWQGSVMMGYHQLPLLWVGGNKEDPAHPLHFELHTQPPVPLHMIEEKARHVKRLVFGEDILESGKQCDDPNHWPCRYQHLRPEPETLQSGDEQGDKSVLVVSGSGMDEVNRMVRQYIYNKGQADELAAGANRERDSILELGKGYDQIVTDTWVIPIYGGTTRYLDEQAMRDDGIDVEKYRRTKPKSRWLNKRNIKRRTDDNANKD